MGVILPNVTQYIRDHYYIYIYSIVIGFPYIYPVLTQSQFYMKVSEALHPQHEMLVTCTTSFVAMEVLPSTFTFTMTCGESF